MIRAALLLALATILQSSPPTQAPQPPPRADIAGALVGVIKVGLREPEPSANVVRRTAGETLFDGSYDWHSNLFAHWVLLTHARLEDDEALDASLDASGGVSLGGFGASGREGEAVTTQRAAAILERSRAIARLPARDLVPAAAERELRPGVEHGLADGEAAGQRQRRKAGRAGADGAGLGRHEGAARFPIELLRHRRPRQC